VPGEEVPCRGANNLNGAPVLALNANRQVQRIQEAGVRWSACKISPQLEKSKSQKKKLLGGSSPDIESEPNRRSMEMQRLEQLQHGGRL